MSAAAALHLTAYISPRREHCLNRLFLVLCLLHVSIVAASQDQTPAAKQLTALRVTQAPIIDGHLNEPIWQSAVPIGDLVQIRPNDGTPISERTEVYVLFDDDALYIGARMWDSAPDRIIANIMKQGSGLAEDDRLAVVVDPFNTGRNGYRFEVNANGVRNDMLYQNNRMQSEWTVIWDAAASTDTEGWIAEIAIPFKTLPFNANIDSWGFNISRAIRRKGEEAVWVSRNRTWNPSIVGSLEGLTGMDQGIGLDVVPSLSLVNRKIFAPADSLTKLEPTLDAYYRITPSLSGSMTINTDFSATEVDDRQVNLTRFNLFFPEKRDFFLNDADLFEFGRIGQAGVSESIRSVSRAGQENARPFFSRRLGLSALGTPVDLEYGGKLSGRIGAWTLGALAVRQDEFVQPDGTIIAASDALVGRVTADVLTESSIGIVATSGNPTSNLNNSLVGMDFTYLNTRLPGNRVLEHEIWYQQSHTEGLNGEDHAFGIGLRMPNAEGLRGGLGYKELGQNFNPGLGFVSRVGVRDMVAEFGHTSILQTQWMQSAFIGADANRVESLDGSLQSQIVALRPLELETRARDMLKLIYTANDEVVARPFTVYRDSAGSVVVPVGRHEFDDHGFEVESAKQRRYTGKFVYRAGEFYDGERLNLGGEVSWKQSRHFTVKLAYDWNDIELPQARFITRLMRTTAEVGITSNLAWTTLLQYDNVSEIFGVHSRLHWIPRAGREVLLVANRGFQDMDNDNSFQSVNSELALKLSYTLRL